MQKKKSKSVKEKDAGARVIQGLEHAKDDHEIKKIISFHKFDIKVLPITLQVLEEIKDITKCDMKKAVSFVLDTGAVSFIGMRERMIQAVEDIKKKKKAEDVESKKKIEDVESKKKKHKHVPLV